MKIKSLARVMTGVMVLGHNAAFAGEMSEFDFFAQEKVVTTATRSPLRLSDSPVSTFVVSQEDIRRSGATTIPETLRLAPGLHIQTNVLGDEQVSARGFNDVKANKMLVMVDGRSVYLDFLGFVHWESIPVTLAEIDRIEVVLGPGSSLYGANAYNGVINIITKEPEDQPRAYAEAAGGNRGSGLGSLIQSGVHGKTSYKVAGQWNQQHDWRKNDPDPVNGIKSFKGDAAVKYKFGENSFVKLSGGAADSRGEIATNSLKNVNQNKGVFTYGGADYQWNRFKVKTTFDAQRFLIQLQRYYVETSSTTVQLVPNGRPSDAFNTDKITVDMENTVTWLKGNDLLHGATYDNLKLDGDAGAWWPESLKRDHYGFFAENVNTNLPRTTIRVGGRWDHYQSVGGQWAPRGSVVYRLTEDQTLRANISTAYRNPSLLESYYDLRFFLPGTFHNIFAQGNKNLKPEKIISYEAGHHALWGRRVKTDVAAFINYYNHFITFGNNVPAAPDLHVFTNNVGKRIGRGGEASFEYLASSRLTLGGNYSYLYVKDTQDNTSTTTVNEKNTRYRDNPLHKVNGNVKLTFKNGLAGDLQGTWVGSRKIIRDTRTYYKVPSYILLNARVGYSFHQNRAEIYVTGYNLWNNRHLEFPQAERSAIFAQFPEGDPIGQRVMAGASYKF